MFTFRDEVADALRSIRAAGLYKDERVLTTAQSAHIGTTSTTAVNFCANNYLGLADHPQIEAAAADALARWGFGMASVRFICGTQELHTRLEATIADFVGMEAAILFSSCFDANGGVFEVLFGDGDAIVSDELNHASLIDGIRLSKAARYRYRNADMADLRAQLVAARTGGASRICVVTDGVFSMDGSYAPLGDICDLAEEFGAMVLVDDSHAVGFVGAHGGGTPELFGVTGRVDLLTGTLGKALGGASGGYVAGPGEVIDLLRQRARPYLFSNAVAPPVCAGSLTALELAAAADEPREKLAANSLMFRQLMDEAGFELLPGAHPIIAVMFPGENGAVRAGRIAAEMLTLGVYVIAFSFPVVPRGRARIRVQLSAAHTEADIRACVEAFIAARSRVGDP
ncbi:MAG: glycine C-acetyltransferase [Nostocoides sp.]